MRSAVIVALEICAQAPAASMRETRSAPFMMEGPKVGTYGMASAQSYWGRLAALLLRILYALFNEVDWNFVFVDYGCYASRGP